MGYARKVSYRLRTGIAWVLGPIQTMREGEILSFTQVTDLERVLYRLRNILKVDGFNTDILKTFEIKTTGSFSFTVRRCGTLPPGHASILPPSEEALNKLNEDSRLINPKEEAILFEAMVDGVELIHAPLSVVATFLENLVSLDDLTHASMMRILAQHGKINTPGRGVVVGMTDLEREKEVKAALGKMLGKDHKPPSLETDGTEK